MFDLRPLRAAGFRPLAATNLVNESGNWIGEVALAILIYNRTHSALGTASLFLAMRFLPAPLAPLLATKVETLQPRVVMTTLYMLEAALFLGIAVLTRHFSLPIVLVLAALDGTLAVTAKALLRSATAAALAKDGLLREGNAIMNLGVMIATAGSPALAGALVAWRGAEWALLVDAATFVLTALIIWRARNIRVESDRDVDFSGRVRNGINAIRHNIPVRRLMVAIAMAMLLSAVPIPIEVVFAKHTLHAGDSGYGILLASWGLGMVLGAATYAAATDVRLIVALAVGTLLNALGYGGLALAPNLALACAASVVGGLGNGAAWIAAVTAVQERIPMTTQSAVMSVLEGLNQVMPATGFAIGGALTALTSPRIAYAVAAVGVAAVVLFASTRRFDEVFPPDSDPPQPGYGHGVEDLDTQEDGASQRTFLLATTYDG